MLFGGEDKILVALSNNNMSLRDADSSTRSAFRIFDGICHARKGGRGFKLGRPFLSLDI